MISHFVNCFALEISKADGADVLRRSDENLVSESDAGTYICNATNINSGLSSAVQIEVTVLG